MAGRARSKKARVGSKTARFDSETFPDMPQSKRPKVRYCRQTVIVSSFGGNE